jgi:hypothetical protein
LHASGIAGLGGQSRTTGVRRHRVPGHGAPRVVLRRRQRHEGLGGRCAV